MHRSDIDDAALPARRIAGSAARQTLNVPPRLTSRVRSHSASLTSSARLLGRFTAAEFTRPSSRPSVATISATAVRTSESLRTSTSRKLKANPADSASASLAPSATSRPMPTTRAPSDTSNSDVARPIPVAAPVTRITLPATEKVSVAGTPLMRHSRRAARRSSPLVPRRSCAAPSPRSIPPSTTRQRSFRRR